MNVFSLIFTGIAMISLFCGLYYSTGRVSPGEFYCMAVGMCCLANQAIIIDKIYYVQQRV